MSPEWFEWLRKHMPPKMFEEFEAERIHSAKWRDDEISRLQSALSAEQKRREEAQADNARLREALKSVLPDESGRHGGPLIQMVASYEDGTSCNDGYQQDGHKYKINHHDYTRARAALAQKPGVGTK